MWWVKKDKKVVTDAPDVQKKGRSRRYTEEDSSELMNKLTKSYIDVQAERKKAGGADSNYFNALKTNIFSLFRSKKKIPKPDSWDRAVPKPGRSPLDAALRKFERRIPEGYLETLKRGEAARASQRAARSRIEFQYGGKEKPNNGRSAFDFTDFVNEEALDQLQKKIREPQENKNETNKTQIQIAKDQAETLRKIQQQAAADTRERIQQQKEQHEEQMEQQREIAARALMARPARRQPLDSRLTVEGN